MQFIIGAIVGILGFNLTIFIVSYIKAKITLKKKGAK